MRSAMTGAGEMALRALKTMKNGKVEKCNVNTINAQEISVTVHFESGDTAIFYPVKTKAERIAADMIHHMILNATVHRVDGYECVKVTFQNGDEAILFPGDVDFVSEGPESEGGEVNG